VSRAERWNEIKPLVKRVNAAGVEMLLVKDTVEAAEHALSQNYILPEHLPVIKGEREEELKAPSELEQLMEG
jgi:hypothetical protein